MNWLLLVILNCCLGSLYMGICLGQMNIISEDLYRIYSIEDNFTKGLMQSLLTIGGAVGAGSASLLLGLFSRKNALIFTDAFSIFAIAIPFLNSSVNALLISRFFIGANLGLNGVLVPVYINEMAPKERAGFLGTMNQLFITLGILATFLMSYFQQVSLSIPFYQLMLYVPLIPCIIRLLALQTICDYETPQYCQKNNLKQKLSKTLSMIYDQHAEKMMEVYQTQKRNLDSSVNFQTLLTKKYNQRLFIGVSLAALQQLGGINGIMFYSSAIFQDVTNHDIDQVFYLNLTVGIIGVVTALLATLIIEKFGRKPILKYGTLLCFVSLFILTQIMASNYKNTSIGQIITIVSLFSYLFGFGFSTGPLLFIYLTEILPDVGVSFASLTNWMSGGLVAQMFPIIAAIDISYCFGLFSCFNLIAFFIIHKKVIETKGLDKETVDKIYENDKFDYISYQEACSEERFH